MFTYIHNRKIYIKILFFIFNTPNYYSRLLGDLEDEDEVLAWLNEDSTLEIPGKIEEVNTKMLDKILSENEHVVVFFCKYIMMIVFSIIVINRLYFIKKYTIFTIYIFF